MPSGSKIRSNKKFSTVKPTSALLSSAKKRKSVKSNITESEEKVSPKGRKSAINFKVKNSLKKKSILLNPTKKKSLVPKTEKKKSVVGTSTKKNSLAIKSEKKIAYLKKMKIHLKKVLELHLPYLKILMLRTKLLEEQKLV